MWTRLVSMCCAGVICSVLGPSSLAAQSNDVRGAAQCLHEADARIQRLLELVRQAETRASRSDMPADVRRDAQLSVETLEERIRVQMTEAARCLRDIRTSSGSSRSDSNPREGTLHTDTGTVHEIERGTTLHRNVRVELGERVDGTGMAPDRAVQSAMRTIGARLSACYESFSARTRRQSVEMHLALTVNESRLEDAIVESAPDADAHLVQCVERAAQSISIRGQRGRSVYAYVLRLGE